MKKCIPSHFSVHIRTEIRPCIRQNFPNFSFLRDSEMFGCQSSEIFRKKTEFLNSWNFCEKVRKFKFGKSSDINQNCTSISKILKKLLKVWVFESKTLFLGQKVWKSLETGFSKCSEISEIILFQTFQKLWKNDVWLELWKSQKTRSDSKVWLKVRNAGP